AVVVEYDDLEPAIDPEVALTTGAALQFEDLGTNVDAATRKADGDPLADAEVVVRGRFENQRVAVMPMEADAIAVLPGDDGNGHALTVYVSTQMPHGIADRIRIMFELEPGSVRVVAPHVGGAFGGKPGLAAEHAIAIAVARQLDRAVKWTETRSENLVAM